MFTFPAFNQFFKFHNLSTLSVLRAHTRCREQQKQYLSSICAGRILGITERYFTGVACLMFCMFRAQSKTVADPREEWPQAKENQSSHSGSTATPWLQDRTNLSLTFTPTTKIVFPLKKKNVNCFLNREYANNFLLSHKFKVH